VRALACLWAQFDADISPQRAAAIKTGAAFSVEVNENKEHSDLLARPPVSGTVD
jgi:hypothetical protein